MNKQNELLDARVELRKQYLETPGYKKLSDLYEIDSEEYRNIRDNWLFAELLGFDCEDIDEDELETAIAENKDTIHWTNLFKYFDERLKIEDTDISDPMNFFNPNCNINPISLFDIEQVLADMKPYRAELTA
jgi:hypothetical protein